MKILKLILIIVLITTTINISNYSYAEDDIGQIIEEGDSILSKNAHVAIETEDMKQFSDILYNALLSVGIVVAVIIGIVLGVKYIVATTDGKSEEKKKLIAYFIGCAILLSGFGIWKVTVTVFQEIEPEIVISEEENEENAENEENTEPENNNPETTTQQGNSTQSNSGQSSSSSSSSKQKNVKVQRITLDKTVLLLDKDHYNTATLVCTVLPTNAKNKDITWKSSKPSVATVTKKGKVKAIAEGTTTITAKSSNGKKAKCKVTVIGQMKKASSGTPGAVAGRGNSGGYWIVKKVKWSKDQLESYVNSAAQICETTTNYQKYPEAQACTIPYYTGSPHEGSGPIGTLQRHTMRKEKGISATNYLILITSTNQRISVFHKSSNGVWKLVKEDDTSTGKISAGLPDGHSSWDFYLGAIYPVYVNDGGKGNSFIQFTQCRGDDNAMYDVNGYIREKYCSHRAIHYGGVYSNGAPSSAGCNHLNYNGEMYRWLNKNLKNQYGTRIIVY